MSAEERGYSRAYAWGAVIAIRTAQALIVNVGGVRSSNTAMRNGRTDTSLSSASFTSQRTWGEQLALAENTSTSTRAVAMWRWR